MSKDSFDSEFFRKATKVIPASGQDVNIITDRVEMESAELIPNGSGLGNNPATARVEMELTEIKDARERVWHYQFGLPDGKAVGVMKGDNKE